MMSDETYDKVIDLTNDIMDKLMEPDDAQIAGAVIATLAAQYFAMFDHKDVERARRELIALMDRLTPIMIAKIDLELRMQQQERRDDRPH